MKKIFIVICTLIALCVSSEVNAANTIVRDYPFNKEFQTGMLELCRTFECVENTRLDKAIVYTIGKQVVLIVSDPLNTKQIIIIYQKSKLSSSMKSKVFDQFDRLLGVKSNWSR